MSIRFVASVVISLAAFACGSRPAGLDALAERYVRAALQLAQHDPALVEDWRGPAEWRPGPRVPVAQLAEEISSLHRQLEQAVAAAAPRREHARVRYLLGQVRGLRFAVERQLGRSTSIDDQFREEFGFDIPALNQGAVDTAHRELATLLPGGAPLEQRVDALRRSTVIPNARRLQVMQRALAACRQASVEVVTLPADERVTIEFRGGIGWDAFARYDGNHHTVVTINDDDPLTVGRAFRLACHEAYPGHHVQSLLMDSAFGERERPELLLSPGFGPHLLLTEGAAEAGADVALSRERRVALYRDTLFPAAGLTRLEDAATLIDVEDRLTALLPVVTDVARRYLAGGLSQEDAIERLRTVALLPNAPATLAFIEQRRARAIVYGEGRRIVFEQAAAPTLSALYQAFRHVSGLQ